MRKQKTKKLNEYKLGEIYDEDLFHGCMEKPNKLVKITYTFQDKNKNQMDLSLIHKDFIEEEDFDVGVDHPYCPDCSLPKEHCECDDDD
jgi:hypothetical protein